MPSPSPSRPPASNAVRPSRPRSLPSSSRIHSSRVLRRVGAVPPRHLFGRLGLVATLLVPWPALAEGNDLAGDSEAGSKRSLPLLAQAPSQAQVQLQPQAQAPSQTQLPPSRPSRPGGPGDAVLPPGAAQPAAAGFAAPGSGWVAGAVLDTSLTSRALALGSRDKGFGMGHSDLTARGPLGRYLNAQVTAVAHTHDKRFEMELEEAWFETRTLPAGWQIRAGRFASQIGYLNEQHPHTDDFVERPLLYRAFLGSHWIDEGLRFNWTAPTDLYLRLGAELFRGRQLSPDGSASKPGAVALNLRTGGDIGLSQSWQAGLSWVRNRRADANGALADEGEDHDHALGGDAHDHAGHDHGDHDHAALYSGKQLWLVDLTWKWAPEGNNRRQQVRVTTELARVTKPTSFATSVDRHDAASLAVVWRFLPDWEIGARTDWLKLAIAHGDHFHRGRLREHSLALAWKPSHQQAVRLQYTTQRDGQEIDGLARRAIQLQYLVSFGAHGAHSF